MCFDQISNHGQVAAGNSVRQCCPTILRDNIDFVLSTNAHQRSQADLKAHTASLALTSAPRLIIHFTKSRRSLCASRMRTVVLYCTNHMRFSCRAQQRVKRFTTHTLTSPLALPQRYFLSTSTNVASV